MEVIRKNRRYAPYIKTGIVGLTLVGLTACSQGESSTTAGNPAPGGSAGLSGPIVFVRNASDRPLMSFKLKGDSGNEFINAISSVKFENAGLGDMQLTDGDWVFVNLADTGKVAAIDPLRAATPTHEVNLPGGTRPVHIFRDANDGQVIWSMNDGVRPADPPAPPGPTDGDDVENCATKGGGSVTAIHNSHLGPGAPDPEVLGTTCLLADGHKVAAFSTGAGVPKRVFVSSETAGEIAVLDDQEGSATYRQMIHRIDLCDATKEAGLPSPATCNVENPTGATAFTPNNSGPHGIRWSKLTKKIYSFQEHYGEIAEIDPTTFAITNKFDLAGTSYSGYGISPDGRFLLLRGNGTAPAGMRLGVIDLGTTGAPRTDFTIPELENTSAGAFKFSPDGKRFYILSGNSPTSTKQDRLFVFDTSTLTATPPALTLIKDLPLVPSGDSDSRTFESAHTLDILAQGPIGAGEAKYIVVTNRLANSISIINASDNEIKETVPVGAKTLAVLVYESGATERGHQATN